MKYPHCQFDNPEGMNFCGKCANPLTVACTACGHQNLAYKTRLFVATGELYGRLGDKKRGLDFIRKALNLARKSGSKKHQAVALLTKSQLLSHSRPGLIKRSLENAQTLSLEMRTRLLAEKIRLAYKTTGAG
jgi:Double zinc ribbon